MPEEALRNYTPAAAGDFDVDREWQSLREIIARAEARAESPEITQALRRQILGRRQSDKDPSASELENLIRRNRARWLRNPAGARS